MSKYIDVEEIKNRLLQKGVEKSDIEFLLSVYKEHQEKNNITTTDVMENVKGEWEAVEHAYFDTSYRCSVCGEEFFFEVGTPKENAYNFCPNCSADMRGERL